VDLLENAAGRERQAREALALIASRFSWERVAQRFSEILESAPAA
jgi:hypothetical protein